MPSSKVTENEPGNSLWTQESRGPKDEQNRLNLTPLATLFVCIFSVFCNSGIGELTGLMRCKN